MNNKRIARKVLKDVSEQQFQESMSAYAIADAETTQLVAQMDAEVTRIRETYDERLELLRQRTAKEFEVIQTYCTENKPRLFGKRRSMDTLFGTIGFRLGTPRLKLLPRTQWQTVTEELHKYLPDYIRVITEPAKDKLLADRMKEDVALTLQKVGLAVVQDEKFFIEMKRSE